MFIVFVNKTIGFTFRIPPRISVGLSAGTYSNFQHT